MALPMACRYKRKCCIDVLQNARTRAQIELFSNSEYFRCRDLTWEVKNTEHSVAPHLFDVRAL